MPHVYTGIVFETILDLNTKSFTKKIESERLRNLEIEQKMLTSSYRWPTFF